MRWLPVITLFASLTQAAWAEVDIPIMDNYLIDITANAEFYADTNRDFDIAKANSYTFKPAQIQYGLLNHPIWVRLKLVNPTENRVSTRLWLKRTHNLNVLDVYMAVSQEPFKLLTKLGSMSPISERISKSKELVVPLELQGKQTSTLLLKLAHRSNIICPLFLTSPARFEHDSRNTYAAYALFFGAILIVLIYHLLLYLRLREISLLYYCGYLFALGLLFFAVSGVGIEYGIWSINFQGTMPALASCFLYAMLLQFARTFLHLDELSPKIALIIQFLTAVMVGLLFLSCFITQEVWVAQIRYLFIFFSLGTTIAGAFASIRAGYQPAIPFAIAWAFYIMGAFIGLLTAIDLVDHNNFSEYGIQVGAMLQMAFLSLASSERIMRSEHELVQLTQTRTAALEAEVTRRTAALRQIFDNVKSGFFMIDRNLIIQSEFTSSCYQIIGLGFKAGIYLKDALQVDDKQFSTLRLCIEQVFDDLMPARVTLALIPNRLDYENRYVSIEGSVIRDQEEKISHILFTLNDISKLVQAEEQKKIDNAIIGIFRQKNSFLRFLSDFRLAIRRMKKHIKNNAQETVRQTLHTIKGNASVFNLADVVKEVHQVESADVITIEDVEKIEKTFRAFITDQMEIMGISYDSHEDETCQIDKSRVVEFRMRLHTIKNLNQIKLEAWEFTEELCKKPIKELLAPLREMAERLALKLGKHINFSVIGGDLMIDPALCYQVLQNLTHMIRNSLDHGLEESHVRRAAKKPPVGKICITVEEHPDHFLFQIEDDGRGIDPEVVAKIALAKKTVTEAELARMDAKQKQWLIFSDSVSTAKEVTEISGRGVGMSSVYSNLEKVGACLSMDSVVSQGTTFYIILPKPKISFGSKDKETA